VALGKVQTNTSQKIQICADLVFFVAYSEYDCLNFLSIILTLKTVMLPRIESRIQVIRGLRVMLDVDLAALYVVANCDHLQKSDRSA
jgi:hypothetical protein